ncbi:non-hydrolyzing UDP-N-acetylglucosamine 2-epimerase [Trinickia soli]|uniref:UDP-N-acetylglucosamine 2-epimerase (non-hydrolyzing) n=1 Tax=Trinickia soli TaxID=380675 RepID=A0A2N7VWD3_9BURK|nr:UDP-N-acetylglucosamine 2-epimerase (non-hydrolyzing) [Paraburkholderia sp. T12-10]PMS21464.1 UDP-N-acetylglucosamine 2-epimerase (non-hydrolyzing) [Trinickia soli]CAB3698154.1 UDP-N-acetylglucosamine 2-epimerase [Trinickia soli]
MATKIMSVFGTRPEAIKMAPVIKALERTPGLESIVCVSGQHRSMLEQVLELFDIRPRYDLALMTANQTLNGLASRLIFSFDDILAQERPDRVLVHGDTTTACAAALAAFHRRIPVGHVEAGLRTGNLSSPWPEEMNRRVIDAISDLMFAPTQSAKANLVTESLAGQIFVTGNTVIDALYMAAATIEADASLRAELDAKLPSLAPSLPIVLVTGHRRESFGEGFASICTALDTLARSGEVQIVYPIHLNPNVRGPAHARIGATPNLHLIEPLDYVGFVRLMQRAAVVLTDSGGVQEEAPALGKPVLVMRELTERPEALEAGAVRLVGTRSDTIVQGVRALLAEQERIGLPREPISPYGDGNAAERIAAAIAGRPFIEFASRMRPDAASCEPLEHAIAL